MEKLKETIVELHYLHYIAKKFNHMVSYRPDTWKVFKPSRFLYSYFAFNSLCNYNWDDSISNGKEVKYDYYDNHANEYKKIENMTSFIFAVFDYKIDSSYFGEKILSQFLVNKVKNKPKSENEKKEEEEDMKKILRGIETELRNNIKDLNKIYFKPEEERSKTEINFYSKLEHFIKFFELIFTRKETEKKINKDVIGRNQLNEMLHFISLVRNNIFHGSKNIIAMAKSEQVKRLEIYSSILIATNELLFESLERKLKFELHKTYTIRI